MFRLEASYLLAPHRARKCLIALIRQTTYGELQTYDFLFQNN